MGGAEGPTPVTVPTRSQINGFQLEKLATASERITALGRQIKSDGVRVRDAITELAWDGDGANAAELRAEDEYHEFRRAAIELEDMSESVSSGLSWLSDTSNSLKLRVVSCQLQKFDVNDDWVVIDKFDYASADATDESTEDTALREQRAEIAKTETVLLQQLAQTFSDQDTDFAAAVLKHSEALERLTPVSSAIGGGIGDRIGDELAAGETLTEWEQKILNVATTHLNFETTTDLSLGRPTTIPQGHFDFLREISRDLDGLTMKEILALSDGQTPRTRTNLASAVELIGCPGLRTESGDQGGVAQVPDGIRSLLTSDLTTSTGGMFPDKDGISHEYTVIDRLDEVRDLTTFIAAGSPNLQGSDINRGMAKQISEISRATSQTGRAMGNGLRLEPDELNNLMSHTLEIAGQDKIAARDFITGKDMNVTCDNGGRYVANDHLEGLTQHRWGTRTAGLEKMFSWIGDDAGATTPFAKELTRDAATSLGNYLGSEEYLDTNKKLGINTPGLAQIFANAVHPYLGSYVGAEGLAGIPDRGVDDLSTDQLKRVFQSLNTDPEAAATMNTEAAKWQNLMAYHYGADPDAPLATRSGMLNQAMTEGSKQAVEVISDEQKSVYERKKLTYLAIKDVGWLFPQTAIFEPALQQPVTDWVIGKEPTQADATNDHTNPDKIRSLNDPSAHNYSILKVYSEKPGNEWVRREHPNLFDQDGLSWEKIHSNQRLENDFDRAASEMEKRGGPELSDWLQGYDKGVKATESHGADGVK
ncbi:hypothetical protein GII32_01260 [Gordonia amarae]|uniref:TPR repeat region-containing protein n=1 Tax=Gordonia amarae TaxID=36821 RepID=UPI001AF2C4DB|nr:hypothetical protein [Gordonia amarae]QHN29214.1 hypothetical protein GII32_01260 [Gordonia amarae]